MIEARNRKTLESVALPVTLESAKQHLRLEADENHLDAHITDWLFGIGQRCEDSIKQCLMGQTWEILADGFPGALVLPHPVLQIVSVEYLDEAGEWQTLAPASYRVKAGRYESCLKPARGVSWPATLQDDDAVKVVVRCGYGEDANSTPRAAKSWILAMLVLLYDPATTTLRDMGNDSPQVRFLDRLLDGLWVP